MAKYMVMMSCGHEEEVVLTGKSSDRERKIAYFEKNGLCKKCYKKEMQKKAEEEGFLFYATVLPRIDKEDGSLLLNVWFSGNTMPYKDAIKEIGGYRWSEREAAEDSIGLKRSPMYWNKVIKWSELDEEVRKAVSIGATSKIKAGWMFTGEDVKERINFNIALRLHEDWKEKRDKIDAIKKPVIPYILEGHKWNQKIYGRDSSHSIYLDGNKVEITDSEAEEIEDYLDAIEKYQKQIAEVNHA